MLRAAYSDKSLVVDILASAFDDNKSVNYIIRQDDKRAQRIKGLMEYSLNMCYSFGEVFLSEDRKACALVVLPEKKKTTLTSILWDAKLVTSCIGLANIKKTLDRESKIKKLHPEGPIYYLWFIGVDPRVQAKGTGSKLLSELIAESDLRRRPICLETSTLKNIPWYQKFGFTIYNELDLGYQLYFLRRN